MCALLRECMTKEFEWKSGLNENCDRFGFCVVMNRYAVAPLRLFYLTPFDLPLFDGCTGLCFVDERRRVRTRPDFDCLRRADAELSLLRSSFAAAGAEAAGDCAASFVFKQPGISRHSDGGELGCRGGQRGRADRLSEWHESGIVEWHGHGTEDLPGGHDAGVEFIQLYRCLRHDRAGAWGG